MANKANKQATKAVAPTAPVAPPVALSTFGNMAATLTAPAPVATGAKAVTAEQMAAGVAVGCTTGVLAAKHVVAHSAAALAAVPANIAAVSYVLGRPCRVRVPHTLACFAAVQALLAGGPATGAALVGVANSSFIPYAIKNQWLVAA